MGFLWWKENKTEMNRFNVWYLAKNYNEKVYTGCGWKCFSKYYFFLEDRLIEGQNCTRWQLSVIFISLALTSYKLIFPETNILPMYSFVLIIQILAPDTDVGEVSLINTGSEAVP